MIDYQKLENSLRLLQLQYANYNSADQRPELSELDKWINYANARIATSHDYSGQKAAETLQITQDFISDAIALYETLTGKTWK